MNNQQKKGKTYEEIYGVERAKYIKKRIKENNKEQSWELKFGKEKAEIMKKQRSLLTKGKSWEERFGETVAKRMRENLRKKMQNKTRIERLGKKKAELVTKKIILARKGKSYEDQYGKERAEKIKKHLSSIRKKWPKEKIIKSLKKIIDKIGPIKKIDIKTLHYNFDFCTETTVRKNWKDLDTLANKIQINWKKPKKKRKIGLNEIGLLDEIEKENNIKLERQHPVHVNNSYKYIDGYDPINKVAYEVDESHHKRQEVKDFIREREIKDKLGCEFVRIKD